MFHFRPFVQRWGCPQGFLTSEQKVFRQAAALGNNAAISCLTIRHGEWAGHLRGIGNSGSGSGSNIVAGACMMI